MTFSEYMKLYIKAEDAHALYRAWADGRKAIGELLKKVSEDDAHSQGQKIVTQLREVLSAIEAYCKVLKDDMKKAEDALGTDEARTTRRNYAEEIHEWRIEVRCENADEYEMDDYPLMPIECDIRHGERIRPEEEFDFIAAGMGI